jgi:NADH-quinone oxidoreductase subunit J
MIIIFFFLNLISALVFTVYNPVYAAFWLIITFFLSAILIWIFNSSFFALIYIIIYVGAIAVLFLFVIMMLEIKIIDYLRQYDFNAFKQIITYLIFSLVPFFFSVTLSLQMFSDNLLEFEENCDVSFDLLIDLQAVGQVLYNHYIFCVLLGGLVLLVAIIGAIVLTFNMNNKAQKKIAARQLARSENFLSFFK